KYWPTVEHYFQAQKFIDTPLEDIIRCAPTPHKAKSIAKLANIKLRRNDWFKIREQIMLMAILCKFETHSNLRDKLLDTENKIIIENSKKDYYWGCGKSGKGRNTMGKILMRAREILRRKYMQSTDNG
ncbi:MAG: NADAR family protein, partial [Candidatus Dadabacteria bacterium]|nr:NADAR family protein [Candidatus Dadabacteria bacterium]